MDISSPPLFNVNDPSIIASPIEDSLIDHHRATSQNLPPSSTLMFVPHTIAAIDVPSDSIDNSSVVDVRSHKKSKFSSEAQRLRNNCLQRRTDRKRRLKEGWIMDQLRALIAESEINEEKEGREREGITRVQIIEKSALVIKMLNDKINQLNKSLNNPSVNERGVDDQQTSLSSPASGVELSSKRRRMHSLDLSNADDSCQSLISSEPSAGSDDWIIDDPHSNTSDSSQHGVNDLVLLSTLQSSLYRVQSIHDGERRRYEAMMVYGASLLSSSHQVFLIDIVGRTLECPRTDLGALKDYNLGRVMYSWITIMHAVLHSFVPYFYSTPFPYLIDAKFLQDKHSSATSVRLRGETFNEEEGSNVSDDRLMQWTQLAASILSSLLQSFDREEDFQKFLYGLLFNQRGGVKPLPRPIVDLHMKFPNIEAERLFVSFASFLPTKAFFQSMATLYSGQSSAPIACPMLSIAADGVGIKEFCISPVIRPRANHANILQGFMVIPLNTLQRFDAGHVKKTIISTLFKSGMMIKAPGINLMNEKIR